MGIFLIFVELIMIMVECRVGKRLIDGIAVLESV
jgi:hypothetical protein